MIVHTKNKKTDIKTIDTKSVFNYLKIAVKNSHSKKQRSPKDVSVEAFF